MESGQGSFKHPGGPQSIKFQNLNGSLIEEASMRKEQDHTTCKKSRKSSLLQVSDKKKSLSKQGYQSIDDDEEQNSFQNFDDDKSQGNPHHL